MTSKGPQMGVYFPRSTTTGAEIRTGPGKWTASISNSKGVPIGVYFARSTKTGESEVELELPQHTLDTLIPRCGGKEGKRPMMPIA